MKISDIHKPINETGYPGNIGIMELVKFMRTASDDEKSLFDSLLQSKKTLAAWKLLQQVTGSQLVDVGYKDPENV